MKTAGKWLLAVAVFALMVVAMPKAALALSATASASNYSGACPGKVAFSGTITGTPNTNVTYAFFYYDPGSGGKTITLATHPASTGGGGSVNVSDSGSVTGSGAAWMQLEVTSPGLVYSNKVNFTVACGAPPPPPTPRSWLTPVRCTACTPLLTGQSITLAASQAGWQRYKYVWIGLSTSLPEFGTGCPGMLCVGWIHYKQGDSAWLVHENFFWRSFVLFDQTKISGLPVKKAILDMPFASANEENWHVCVGGVGRATRDWRGQSGQDQLTQNDATNGDFSAHWFASSITSNDIQYDVTPIVQAWASGSEPNLGFALRGATEDNGSDGNDSCVLDFATNPVLHIQT